MSNLNGHLGGVALALLCLVPASAFAESGGPFYEGAYLAPMLSYVHSGADRLGNGHGGQLAVGYRNADSYALEFAAFLQKIKSDGNQDAQAIGGAVNLLWFPFARAPNLYGMLSLGASSMKQYPVPGNNGVSGRSFSLTRPAAGLGYLLPLSIGRYEFGLRAEAQYVENFRDKSVKLGGDPAGSSGDPDAPRHFGDVLVNVGLQLPLGLRPAAPPPEPAVAVVQAPPVKDSDGDGVPDDQDRCPDTPQGTKVDAEGCPVKPCKEQDPAQSIDLSTCAAGDKLVLRGVNFEFDQSRLTLDAKTILDGVVTALTAAPNVNVEIGGHTDNSGGDEYNQHLSEARAKAVQDYLIERGVAPTRLSAAGYGESQPVADNASEQGRELNRRVELKVTQGAAAAEPAISVEGPAAADPQSAEPVNRDAAASLPNDAMPAAEAPAAQ